METRGKNEWGFLVVLAVGAVAYYFFTVKPSPNPEKRRKEIQLRLNKGASPLTLLHGGFSATELLRAGVPREALRSVGPVPSSTLLSQTTLEEPRGCPTGAPCFSCEYEPLRVVTSPAHDVPGALHDGLRSCSRSTSVSEVREVTHGNSIRSAASPSVRSCSRDTENLPNNSRLSSARLVGHVQGSPARQNLYKCNSIERTNATWAPAGTHQVQVAALSAVITCGYSSESAAYHHPLDVHCFLHEDGSRLSIMAEGFYTLKSDEELTTEAYVKRSLARARAAADDAKTYFKVKLSTAARKLATTVMESYVNIYVGSSPVILAGFYLVKGNIAYTIQLQTHAGAYEARLQDLLYTAQSARLQSAEETVGRGCRVGRGWNEYHVQAKGVDPVYVVETPLTVAVQGTTAPQAARSELILTPCRGLNDTGEPWKATIAIFPNASREHAQNCERRSNVVVLLHDEHVSIELIVHMVGRAVADTTSSPPPLPPPLAAVLARQATTADRQHLSSVYRSTELTVPLPPPEHFQTIVCEHRDEPSLTLFITPLTSSELFELEVRRLSRMDDDSLKKLFSFVETLFLTPSRPRLWTNAEGQVCFSVKGLAVAAARETLSVYGVHLREECWIIFRWLCAASATEPIELEHYRSELVKRIVC